MIRLLLEPVNFLILDEPTNHLDMVSKDVLKDAIKAFDGTVIVVSHDREFLDGLVDKVYEFSNGKVREHLGGIYDYLRDKNAETINDAVSQQNTQPVKQAEKPTKEAAKEETPTPTLSYEERKAEQKRLNKLEKQRKSLEEKISSLEKRRDELNDLLMLPENAANMQMVNEYTTVQEELDKLEEEYFALEI